jgi:hypothetical protein
MVETNSNTKIQMIQTTLNEMQHITDVWNIRTFGFGICFVFRVSDLEFYGQARGDRAKDGFGLACPV